MSVAFKSAARTVNALVGATMLREITGLQRHRIYCADEILRLLDKPLTDEPAPPAAPE